MIPIQLQRVIITKKPTPRLWYEIKATISIIGIALQLLVSFFFLAVFQKQVISNSIWVNYTRNNLTTYLWLYFPETLLIAICIGLLVILKYVHTDWKLSKYGDIIFGSALSLLFIALLSNQFMSTFILNSGVNPLREQLINSSEHQYFHLQHIVELEQRNEFYGQVVQLTPNELAIDNAGIIKTFKTDQKGLYIGAKLSVTYTSNQEIIEIKEII